MTHNIVLLAQHCERSCSSNYSPGHVFKLFSLLFESSASLSAALWKAGEQTQTNKPKRTCQISTEAQTRTDRFSIVTHNFLLYIHDLHLFYVVSWLAHVQMILSDFQMFSGGAAFYAVSVHVVQCLCSLDMFWAA